ncbi:hypothetical protein BGAPBR_Q0045 (plasmid) [Borreliella garinii PBr]|uniref:Uncharacterized protein n=1 Tax=Borreliella garinii PBr TaxID=498743 RepID=B8F1C2_BORGR|nr:hypothetical protein BGAPBR_Q0045 [Borreliella garinii PBr]
MRFAFNEEIILLLLPVEITPIISILYFKMSYISSNIFIDSAFSIAFSVSIYVL